MAGSRPWSSSAVGRSWRARFSSSSIAWFTSRLSSVSSSTRSGGLSWASASRRSRIAVSAWFTSSWRSRASRRRSSSCARMTSVPERRRSSSMRSSRRLKELDEPVDLLGRVGRGELVGGRLGGVDPLDPLDQALERREAALEHPEVHAEREHDREREDQELPALVADGEVEARREARREQREGDEHDVGGHDLADQGIVASRHRGSLHESEQAPLGTNGVSTPYRHGARKTRLLVRLRAGVLPGASAQSRSGSSAGASERAPRLAVRTRRYTF